MIEDIDVRHALDKWRGQTLDGEFYSASDSEFFTTFSNPSNRIQNVDVRRFSAANSEVRRTGGYSISRAMWGGAGYWAPVLSRIREDPSGKIGGSRLSLLGAAVKLHRELADTVGTSRTGLRRPLGISAASKFLFFMFPRLPLYIYDDVARIGAGIFPVRLSAAQYPRWVEFCEQKSRDIVDATLIESCPRGVPLDWFKRRCLDLALYRQGKDVVAGR